MKKRVAIIGGGIAGLTFARCLDTNKFDVFVYEKKTGFGEVGAAISVFPNALSVLDKIGLLSPILDTSGKFENVYLKTDKGSILSKSAPKSDYPVICMHRADLHKILLNNINAELHKGVGLVNVEYLENGQIRTKFDNGLNEVFDAVIGADGINSVLRQFIINDGEPVFRGYNIWRGVVKTTFDVGYGSETYGNGKRVGIVPIKDGVYGWWATCNEEFLQNDEPEGTKVKLNRLFGNWHHPIPDLINNTDTIIKNSLCDRKPHKGWSKNNSTLIGDAAHPTTPNLGQGGCIAIEGAYLLAKCLNKYGIGDKAFSTYEKIQYPRAKMVNQESLRLGQMGQLTNPILISLRNFFFKITPSSVAMKMIDKFFSYRITEIDV